MVGLYESLALDIIFIYGRNRKDSGVWLLKELDEEVTGILLGGNFSI